VELVNHNILSAMEAVNVNLEFILLMAVQQCMDVLEHLKLAIYKHVFYVNQMKIIFIILLPVFVIVHLDFSFNLINAYKDVEMQSILMNNVMMEIEITLMDAINVAKFKKIIVVKEKVKKSHIVI
jgi:hypothetical protein